MPLPSVTRTRPPIRPATRCTRRLEGRATPALQGVLDGSAHSERLALYATTELVDQTMAKRDPEGNGETDDHDHQQIGRPQHQSSSHASLAW